METDYNYLLSLQRISLLTLAISFWTHETTRNFILRFNLLTLVSCEQQRVWQKIENEVFRKIRKLQLPQILKIKLSGFVKPIGNQILSWIEFHSNVDIKLPNKFVWTAEGTINRKETADVFVRDESVAIHIRYNLACIYCLESDIHMLWGQLDNHYKNVTYIKNCEPYIVRYWSYHMRKEVISAELLPLDSTVDGNFSLHANAFKWFAFTGNKVACRYFLNKLRDEERASVVMDTATVVTTRLKDSSSASSCFMTCDMLHFLLSLLTVDQQMLLCERTSARLILQSFLNWPLQNSFMKMADIASSFFLEKDYYCVLQEIIFRVRSCYQDYNYEELFGVFWQKIPSEYKLEICDSLLHDFITTADDKSLILIVNALTAPEREKLICSVSAGIVCRELVYGNKWNLLEFFIRQCVTRKDLLAQVEKDWKVLVSAPGETKEENDSQRKLFIMLENIASELKK